jgi:hypothetical protein
MMEHPDLRGLDSWQQLARSPHALVWKARQPALDRAVAVKVYTGMLDPAMQQTFLRVTAQTARLAAHRGVVTVHDAGVLSGGQPYVVTELGLGGSVASWLDGPDRPGEERVAQLGAVVADALATAHAAGVLHGGVKPTNILIDAFDAPVLVDFGAAIVHGAQHDRALVPESHYAAPEASGPSTATAAGDVYALAATLIALLAGRPPHNLADRSVGSWSAGLALVLPLRRLDPALRRLLLAALDQDVAARPDALELRDGLLRRTRAGTPGPPAAVPSAPVRRRARLLVGAAALTLLGSAGAVLAGGALPSGPLSTISAARPTPTTAPAAASAASVAPSAPPRTAAADGPGAAPAEDPRIEVVLPTRLAAPFEPVRVRGTHTGSPGTAFLRVQRWERGGWRDFPLPTRADEAGRISTYVELGQPGRYPIRVLDPESGVASEPVVLVVRS